MIRNIKKIVEQIQAYEEELAEEEKKYHEYCNPSKPAAASSDRDDGEDEEEDDGAVEEEGARVLNADGEDLDELIDLFDSDKDSKAKSFVVHSNDGSRDLDDDEIVDAEEVPDAEAKHDGDDDAEANMC